MKRIFTGLMACAIAAAGAAAELDVMPYYSADLCWSGASLSGSTATWDTAWGGLVFDMDHQDYSAYDYLVIDFAEPTTAKLKLEAYYGDAEAAGSDCEVEAGAKRVKLDLDAALKGDIQKLAVMSAKPATAVITKAVLTDEFTVDPVLWEGEFEIVNMNTSNFTIKNDKFAALKAGDKLTVYFTVGSNANYGTIQLCYGWTKLACDANRTNVKPDGNYAATATETSVVITDAADIEGLKKSGLRIKGKNVTIRKVMLTPEGSDPEPPEPTPGPDEPEGSDIWTGSVDTGEWKNNVSVAAAMFASVKAGDVLTVALKVNAGFEYGNIELDDQKYTKLEMDGTSADLDSYGCVQPDVTALTYIVTAADAALLKANGLLVKGANITITKVSLESGDEEEPGDDTTVWTGSVDTGEWKNDVTVDAPKFRNAKAGDFITISLSVNDGADYGNIELDDQNYVKLAMDGTSAGLDSYGCVQPGTSELTYVIANGDIDLLKANGLRVKGANITITKVVVSVGEPLDPEPEPTDVVVVWSGSVNCGQWKQQVDVDAEKFADMKPGDKITVNLSRNAGKGTGTPEVQAQNGTVLSCNGKGTNLDGSGNLVKGATEVTYTPSEADLALLASHGLRIRGFAVTITKVSVKYMESASVSEIAADDAPVEYYNLQGVRVQNPGAGVYIRRQGNNVTKVMLR
ncbi:MAG: hypothetical protein K2L27_00240 [Muribaculaceae bacterium]|nr:hypothetical protein [Muribaculaceae bacterium]